MPRQNRVTPDGQIIAVAERGTFMGNRGVLHRADGQLRRRWQNKRWIICLLAFKGRKRPLMRPGCYTELFFLDEATALAAGHRPCAECRRASFNAFRQAWAADMATPRPSANRIDQQLHAERLAPDGTQATYVARLDELPNGVFVKEAGRVEAICLVWDRWLLPWAAAGYSQRRARPRGIEVLTLTPRSTMATLRAGYVPAIHPSAVGLVSGTIAG